MGSRIVDLSHPVEAGMVTYPGLPVPEIHAVLDRATSAGRYAPGVTFQIDLITLCGNTGTYMDSPFHRWEDGPDLAGLPLERLVDLPAVMIDVTGSGSAAIDADAFRPHELAGPGRARPHRLRPVLADGRLPPRQPVPDPRCRGAAGRRRRRARGHRLAEHRLHRRSRAAGPFDPAARRDPDRRAHDEPRAIPVEGARFTAIPAPIRGTGTFPVRAIAVLPGGA